MKRLTCKELISFLDDYLDQRLEQDVLYAFEQHLTRCPPCKDYLKTYRDTIKMTKAAYGEETEAPSDAPATLIDAILAARKRGAG
jgi:anti-sigma factor RsiW